MTLGVEPGAVGALTTGVDIFATLADIFGVTPEHRIHGVSLVPLIEGSAKAVREYALSGVWGREVHVVDGHYKYVRAPAGGNAPLSMWSNRWSTMPIPSRPPLRLPRLDERATLDRMPGTRVPVIRQPFVAGDLLPFWALGAFSGNHLYNLEDDPTEDENHAGEKQESEHADRMLEALLELEAPADHFERLGLS